MTDFMANLIERGHAEVAPPLSQDAACWYLPLFGVYHPKKPGQIRVVFDSSAKHDGVSLNDVLLSGPDLTNNLLGVLLRFRKDPVAVTADVEQMFHNFKVEERHRDHLRFLWHKDNDPDCALVDYRMTVHTFGNSPSPAVATYGLRKSVEHASPEIKDFVSKDFYVDDGLTSRCEPEEAVKLVRHTASTEGGWKRSSP